MSDFTILTISAIVAVVAGISFYVPMMNTLRSVGLERTNFRGERVVTSGGLFVLFTALFAVSLLILVDAVLDLGLKGSLSTGSTLSMLLLVCGVTLIGLVDDLALGGRDKGLGGHIKAFFEGRITTGFLKASVGLMFSLLAAAPLSQGIFILILNTVLLAVAINLFNIFDLRPGRSSKLFLLGVVVILLTAVAGVSPAVMGAFLGALIVFLIADLKELAMLGDAGANMLGAVFGFLLVSSASLSAKVVMLAVMLAVELIGDRFSLSKVIASNPVLRTLDELGRRPDNS